MADANSELTTRRKPVTTAIQLWSEHQTVLVLGAALLLAVVFWLVWAGSRKRRCKTEAKLVERGQPGRTQERQQAPLRKPRAEASAAHAGTAERHTGIAVTQPALAFCAPPATVPPSAQSCGDAGSAHDQAKPALVTPTVDATASAKVQLVLDSESGPVGSPPAPVIEGLPEMAPRPTRDTPRAPTVVAGSSIGAYRMVRPSEPDVFTPPPSTTPTPGARASGEQTPGPRPSLSLSAKMRRSELGSNCSPVPATGTQRAPGNGNSPTDPPRPAPRTAPEDTIRGTGSDKPAK